MSLTQIDLRVQHGHKYEKRINSECYSIKELYWSFLREYDVGKVKKCTINISDKYTTELEDYNNWRDSKGVFLAFNFEEYVTLCTYDKKKMQLDTIHSGMIRIAEKEGWNKEPLIKAYNTCINKKLIYQFEVGELKTSPDRKFKMSIWCNWDLDIFQLYWVLYDKNNLEISRNKFVEKQTHEGEFVYYLKWKWLDEMNVVVENKYKYGNNETWRISIDN